MAKASSSVFVEQSCKADYLHSNNRGARGDVLDETSVKGARGEVNVVLLGQGGRRGQRLDAIPVSFGCVDAIWT